MRRSHQAADRARRVIDGIRASGDDGPRERTVGLVTHGFFGQYLIRALLGNRTCRLIQIDNNTSISRFRIATPASLVPRSTRPSRTSSLTRR